jgi:hypothetical protein
MSKQQLIVKEMSQFPAAIKKLWGPPSILPSEDAEVYWKFALAIAHSVDPADAIAWILLKDLVDHSWEIRELRKHRAQIIRIEASKFLAEQTAEAREEFKQYLGTPEGEAQMFFESVSRFENINELIEAAERRRMASLREIEKYKSVLASRLRKASDDAIIEGQFTETDPASGDIRGEPAAKTDVKADNDSAAKENDGAKSCDAA